MNAPNTLTRQLNLKPAPSALDSGDRLPSEEFMHRYEQQSSAES